MNLLVVIVNYKTAPLVIECLRSLSGPIAALPTQLAKAYPDSPPGAGAGVQARVTVVDNASGDGSVQTIEEAIRREGWGAWAGVVASERNGGFAAGNNVALRAALALPSPPDFFYLLNPDTKVRPETLAALLDFMARTPAAGIAGSQLENPAGGLERSEHPLPTPWGELERTARIGTAVQRRVQGARDPGADAQPRGCGWVTGAALMVRREVLEKIGFMDEGFFLYFEEVDLCERAKRGGFEVWHVPASRVVHLEGAATGGPRSPHWYVSRRRFFLKTQGVLGLLTADFCWSLGTLLRWPQRLVTGRKPGTRVPSQVGPLLWGDIKAICEGNQALDNRA